MILSFVWSHVDAKGPFKVNDRQEVNYFTYLIQKPLLVHIMKSGEIRKGQDSRLAKTHFGQLYTFIP